MVEDITRFSNMELRAGDTLTVSTLLYGMLIPSGNDGADALARHVGSQLSGSSDPSEAAAAFVAEMNAFAETLGLRNTRFTNPSGLDAETSYSTAHDLAILFGELMKDETLARIVAEPAYSFYSVGPENRQYQADSTNQRLNQNGVIGGKTGSTGNAGGCVVLARNVEGSGGPVITAILGSDLAYDDNDKITTDVRWDDADRIFDAMDNQFAWTTPGSEGTVPGLTEELSIWGVQFRDPPAMPFPTGSEEPATYQLVLGPPAVADEQSGVVRFFFGDSKVGEIPVYQVDAQAVSPHIARLAA
jgi:D-alanyl-D-alanine carboxypeptidase